VAGGVDEVELVGFAVVCLVHHADGVGLDGDAALALEVHGVEYLGLHLAGGQRAGQLEESVRKGGLAVVDVRDDREVADVTWIHFVACVASILILTPAEGAAGSMIRYKSLDRDPPGIGTAQSLFPLARELH